MVPPFEKHALADELEPRRKFEGFFLEHILQIFLGNPARVSDFVGVDVEVDVGRDE